MSEVAAELLSLVDRELVRVLDLILLRKNEDGSVEVDGATTRGIFR